MSQALKALAEEGVVERDPDTLGYRLGWRLFSLVARTTEDRLVRTAEPVMRELAAELEETNHLCVLRDREVLTLLAVSGHSFRAGPPHIGPPRRLREEFEPGLVEVSAPAERLGERQDEAGRETAKAAASISAHLGWEDRPKPTARLLPPGVRRPTSAAPSTRKFKLPDSLR